MGAVQPDGDLQAVAFVRAMRDQDAEALNVLCATGDDARSLAVTLAAQLLVVLGELADCDQVTVGELLDDWHAVVLRRHHQDPAADP